MKVKPYAGVTPEELSEIAETLHIINFFLLQMSCYFRSGDFKKETSTRTLRKKPVKHFAKVRKRMKWQQWWPRWLHYVSNHVSLLALKLIIYQLLFTQAQMCGQKAMTTAAKRDGYDDLEAYIAANVDPEDMEEEAPVEDTPVDVE